MIDYSYKSDFELFKPISHTKWIQKVLQEEGFEEGDINYIFCDDAYLLKLNIEFLNHDTLTDIISFDYVMGELVSGDVFISVERVHENAKDIGTDFNDELNRVMVHGILHYCGYKDKTTDDAMLMRAKEDYYLSKFV